MGAPGWHDEAHETERPCSRESLLQQPQITDFKLALKLQRWSGPPLVLSWLRISALQLFQLFSS